MKASKDSTTSKPAPAGEDAAHDQRWREIGAQMAAERQGDQQQTRSERATQRAQAMVDGLNRHVMARHEADLAALPPEVRASKTPEEWLVTPPLEIMRLAAKGKAVDSEPTPLATPVPGGKGWARRAGAAIAASFRRATAGK